MPIDLDENLVNAAIIEFHSARDHGRGDAAAWTAAVSRIRYDVLRIAATTCESLAQRLPEAEARGAHACNVAIRELY